MLIWERLVLREVKDANQTFDFIVCTNKAVDQASTAADIAPGVGENTTIVIIQNGVGNEDAFRERFPSVTIISCVVRRCIHSTTYRLTSSRHG